ncbi:MAG: chemotaxis protein CheX [Planctomycetes bacterium]|nr:chemotaxis protein CheX [Planctomycetota bacterium]
MAGDHPVGFSDWRVAWRVTRADVELLFSVVPKIRQNCGKDIRAADVSAAISFSGQAVGSVVLCFSKQVARTVASKFAGGEISVLNADLADALGELANMVAGLANGKMNGLDMSTSLPRVAIGSHITLKNNRIPVLTLPCDSPLGRFSIEVSMELKMKPESIPEPASSHGASV